MGAPPTNESIHAINKIAASLGELRLSRPSLKFAAERSAKGGQTVAAILKAAREVFMREGHAGLTMRLVAEEADIAVGNISYYFPTKNELIEAILREQMVDYVEEHLKLIEAHSGSPIEILLDTVEFYVTNSRSSYQFFFQAWAYAGSDEAAKALVSELYRSIGQFIYRLVKAVRPDFDHERVVRTVLQISSLVQGLGLFVAIGPQDNPGLATAESDVRDLVRKIVEAA